MRIMERLLPRSGGPILDLHPFVDNQYRTATSHLQHAAGIPNSWAAKVARIANLPIG